MRTLTIELDDQQMSALEARAEQAGTTPDGLVRNLLDRELDLFDDEADLDLANPLAGIGSTIPDGARALLGR